MISVIVPVYNVDKYIEKCISSLLDQSFQNFEVLIIDDGSTDSSIEIAQRLIGGDSRFTIYTKENGGLSSARNFGIRKAKYDYLSFLDSDDYFHPHFLHKMYERAIVENADVVISDLLLVDEKGMVLREHRSMHSDSISGIIACRENLLATRLISMAQNKLFRKSLFEDIEFMEGVFYEDRATTYKLFLRSKTVAFVPEFLFYYLQRPGSIMNGISEKKILDRAIVVNSIKQYLVEKDVFSDCENEYISCYLLNAVLSPCVQIAIYHDSPRLRIEELLRNCDWDKFSTSNIFKLFSVSRSKALALLVLKTSVYGFVFLAKLKKNPI